MNLQHDIHRFFDTGNKVIYDIWEGVRTGVLWVISLGWWPPLWRFLKFPLTEYVLTVAVLWTVMQVVQHYTKDGLWDWVCFIGYLVLLAGACWRMGRNWNHYYNKMYEDAYERYREAYGLK